MMFTRNNDEKLKQNKAKRNNNINQNMWKKVIKPINGLFNRLPFE